METHRVVITIRDCAVRYGLSETDLYEFVELGLLHAPADAPDVLLEEPERLARLARLQHDLSLSKESIDVVLAMRQRLVELQAEVAYHRARATQLEAFLRGAGPQFDAD